MDHGIRGISSEKEQLRRKMRQQRQAIAAKADWKERCNAMQQRILSSSRWAAAENVVLYIAVKGEPDTSLLLHEAWKSGRNVFLPRCRPGCGGEMDLIACSSIEGLRMSSFGIPEPVLNRKSQILSQLEMTALASTLVVTPAITFDRQGYRLGYGGGYYDRLFSESACASVGLAYAELLATELPREPWDRPVDAVYTEYAAYENGDCI